MCLRHSVSFSLFVSVSLFLCVQPQVSKQRLWNGRECIYIYICGAWWLIGRFVTFRPKGRGFEYRSSRHVGTLGKSFTRSCLWCFGVKLRHSIRAVLTVPLSSSGLEEALYKSP